MDKLCPSTRDLLPSHILSSVFRRWWKGKEPGRMSAQPSSQPSSQEAEASRSLVVEPRGDGFTRCRHIPAPQARTVSRGSSLGRVWLLTRGLFQTQESGLSQSTNLCPESPPSNLPWVPGVGGGESPALAPAHRRSSHWAARPRLPWCKFLINKETHTVQSFPLLLIFQELILWESDCTYNQ